MHLMLHFRSRFRVKFSARLVCACTRSQFQGQFKATLQGNFNLTVQKGNILVHEEGLFAQEEPLLLVQEEDLLLLLKLEQIFLYKKHIMLKVVAAADPGPQYMYHLFKESISRNATSNELDKFLTIDFLENDFYR